MSFFFLSYSHQDRSLVKGFAAKLGEKGKDVWWDEEGINVDDPRWRVTIVDRILTCGAFVLVLTEHAAASDEVLAEVDIAQEENKPLVVLVIGEPFRSVPKSGLRPLVARRQQVRCKSIDDAVVEKVIKTGMIVGLPPDIPEKPDPSEEEQEFGSVAVAGPLSVHQVCAEYVVSQIRQGQLGNARDVLREMEDRRLCKGEDQQVKDWLTWRECYDRLRRQRAFGDVLGMLKRQADELAEEEPEVQVPLFVKNALKREWSRQLEWTLGEWSKALRGETSEQARKTVSALASLFDRGNLPVLDLFLEEDQLPSERFAADAKTTLETFLAPVAGDEAREVQEMMAASLPPLPEDVENRKQGWSDCARRRKAMSSFRDELGKWKEVEAVGELQRHIRSNLGSAIPDFGNALAAARAWEEVVAHFGPTARVDVEHLLARLSEVERAFGRAKEVVASVRKWLQAGSAYRAAGAAADTSIKTFLTPAKEYGEATERVRQRLDKAGAPAAMQSHLQKTEGRLKAESLIYGALGSLQPVAGDAVSPRRARQELEKISTPVPDGVQDLYDFAWNLAEAVESIAQPLPATRTVQSSGSQETS